MSSWGKPSNLKPVGHVPGAAPAPTVKPKTQLDTKWGSSQTAPVVTGPLSINLAPAPSVAKPIAEIVETLPENKPATVVRAAAGKTWEDPVLATWNPNDFRVFVGNLSNDVTDAMLKTAFAAYPSLTNHRVVRDSKSGRSKGYGFLAFSDPADYTRAMREMNGKYIGTKPVKLTRSSWKDRNVEVKNGKGKKFKPY